MKHWPETTMNAAAILIAGLFMAGLSWPEIFTQSRRIPDIRTSPSYHGGKAATLPDPDPSCQSDSCHDAIPHKKDRNQSVFRNMHLRSVDCLSCHGEDAERHWDGGPRMDGKGRRIRYSAPAVKGDPHDALRRDTGCRKCHSESGRRKLLEKGVPGLTQGFVDPIALRMIEGGSRRWVPADMR